MVPVASVATVAPVVPAAPVPVAPVVPAAPFPVPVAPVVALVVAPVAPVSPRVVLQDLRYLSQEQGIPRSATPLDPAPPSREAAVPNQDLAQLYQSVVFLPT